MKIVRSKKINKLNSNYFFIKDIPSYSYQKRFHVNHKLNFFAKIYEIWKKMGEQNYLFQKDLQLWPWVIVS